MSTPSRQTQALDILGDILEDTEEEARNEERLLAEQLRQRDEEAKAAAIDEARRRSEDAERRLAEEEARRRAAAERRNLAERAMQQVDEPEEVKVVAVKPVVAAEPEKKSNVIGILIAAVLLGAIGVGGFLGYTAMTREFVDTDTVYSAAVAAPTLLAANTAEQQVAVIGKPNAPIEEDGTTTGRRPAARRGGSGKPAAPAAGGLRLGGGISGRN